MRVSVGSLQKVGSGFDERFNDLNLSKPSMVIAMSFLNVARMHLLGKNGVLV